MSTSAGQTPSAVVVPPVDVSAVLHRERQLYHSFAPAVISGALQAVLFNPFDRALYLRVHHRRSFLARENFAQPFQGFSNAAVYRTISSGTYLFFQERFRVNAVQFFPGLQNHPVALNLLVGTCAGSGNAALLNQMQLVKYHMWTAAESLQHGANRSATTSPNFISIGRKLFADGGVPILFRGVGVSIFRDVVFGLVYESLRMPHITVHRDEGQRFAANTIAAAFASVVCSPLNYCRNMIYSSPSLGCPLRIRHLLMFLVKETRLLQHATLREKWTHLNGRLNVGWCSFRVGLGMAVGQWCFARAKHVMIAAVPPVPITAEELVARSHTRSKLSAGPH